jgi:hypothetical protein
VYYHLVNNLWFTMRRLRRVPHGLPQGQKQARVDISMTPLGKGQSAKHNCWRNFATLDESCSCCHADYESAWLSGDDRAPEKERRIMTSSKLMMIVVRNPVSLHIVDVLPRGMKFYSSYHLPGIMDTLLAALRQTSSIHSGSSLSMRITVVSTRQRW